MTLLRVRPTTFSSGDVLSWLQRFELCAKANEWKPEDKPTILSAFLDGQALAAFQQMSADDQQDLNKIKKTLTATFRQPPEVAMTSFQTRSLRAGESLEEFLHDLRRLLNNAMPATRDGPAVADASLLKHLFLTGLLAGIRQKIVERDAADVGALTLP